MKKLLAGTLLLLWTGFATPPANAGHVHAAHARHRTVVRVHTGFPLHRHLPHVYVRTPNVRVRVAPRLFLPPVVFGATAIAVAPAKETVAWRDAETIERDDEWAEFTLNADRRGTALLLEIAKGPAELNFAEVVFDNGDAQVVDFSKGPHVPGIYGLLDFKDGRKIDHVRMVARTESDSAEIRLLLVK